MGVAVTVVLAMVAVVVVIKILWLRNRSSPSRDSPPHQQSQSPVPSAPVQELAASSHPPPSTESVKESTLYIAKSGVACLFHARGRNSQVTLASTTRTSGMLWLLNFLTSLPKRHFITRHTL